MMLSFIIFLLLGSLTAYLAQQRGRDPYLWFAVGGLFGLLGLLVLFLLPQIDKNAETETKQTVPDKDIILVEPLPDPLNAQWYYLDEKNQQQGPIGIRALKQKWLEEGIDMETLVWCEGMEYWKRISQIESLENRLSSES